jgi:hypothetical protein
VDMRRRSRMHIRVKHWMSAQMLAAVERVLGKPDAAALLAAPLCAALCDALLEPMPAAAAAAARHVGSNGSEEAVDSAAVGAYA